MHVVHHGLGRLLEGVRIGRIIPAAAGTPAAMLAITPAGAARRATGLQPLALAAAFILPRPLLVGGGFLVGGFLLASRRTTRRFALALVLRCTFGIRLGDDFLRRHLGGACGSGLGLGILFQTRQIGNPLLLFQEFGFLPCP